MDEQNLEQPRPEPASQERRAPKSSREPGPGRTVAYVLVSVITGFLLPVCSCGLLIMVSVVSIGLAGRTPAPTAGIGDAVAIVEVDGAITSGDEDEFGTGAISGVIVKDLEDAAADPFVKAIVLRVDSPGGTVTGSAQIYEAVRSIDKPVVVSMVSVAASGGYYVSAPADYIIARPDTFTGSIGVIMTLFNADDLLEEVGVDVITISSGPNKAIGSLWEEMSPEHRQILEGLLDESYDEFLRVVSDGRNMTLEEVEALADGRIFSGRQALENGLVDELGNLDAAIAKAADLGGIVGEPRIVEFLHRPTLEQFLTGVRSLLLKSEADRITEIATDFATPSLEYRYAGPGAE